MAPLSRKRTTPGAATTSHRLADWFEHSANPEDFRPRPGRPPLGPDFPSPRIQVRVSRRAYDALVERAKGEGTTVSKLVRQLLEQSSRAPSQK